MVHEEHEDMIRAWIHKLKRAQEVQKARREHAPNCSERWGSGHEQEECHHPCHDLRIYVVIGEPLELEIMISILEEAL